MAQGFDCFCGAETCRGFISGAKNMTKEQLEGIWLNAHIRELLDEKLTGGKSDAEKIGGAHDKVARPDQVDEGHGQDGRSETEDATEEALKASLEQAKKMVESAQKALNIYKSLHGENGKSVSHIAGRNGIGSRELSGEMGGDTRRGVTSRELSGEMGGDTQRNGRVTVGVV